MTHNDEQVAQKVNAVGKTNEDFVVVGNGSSSYKRLDEDFVVVGDELEPSDNGLPEVDASDYLNQWPPIVPKIAALITHELWQTKQVGEEREQKQTSPFNGREPRSGPLNRLAKPLTRPDSNNKLWGDTEPLRSERQKVG